MAADPNVTFHFTPTRASWLNQLEIWFGIVQRKTLNNASLRSTDQLIEAIHAFTNAYNQNAAPFVWRKREVGGHAIAAARVSVVDRDQTSGQELVPASPRAATSGNSRCSR